MSKVKLSHESAAEAGPVIIGQCCLQLAIAILVRATVKAKLHRQLFPSTRLHVVYTCLLSPKKELVVDVRCI